MKTKIVIAAFIIISALFVISVPSYAEDQYGLYTTAKEAGLNVTRTAPQLVGNIIGAGLSFISVVFFALMIWGGLQWMLARGNDEQVKKAQTTIYGAIIGLVVVLASYALTNFVFKSVGPQGSTSGGGSTTEDTTSGGGGEVWCIEDGECDQEFFASSCSEGQTYTSESACTAALGGTNEETSTVDTEKKFLEFEMNPSTYMVTKLGDCMTESDSAGKTGISFGSETACTEAKDQLWVCAGGSGLDVDIEDFVDCTNNFNDTSKWAECYQDNCID